MSSKRGPSRMRELLRRSSLDVARGFALFFGLFGLANGALNLFDARWDANEFWIGAPSVALAPLCVALTAWSLFPARTLPRRLGVVAALVLAVGCMVDAAGVARAASVGTVELGTALSLSAALAVAFALLAVRVASARPSDMRSTLRRSIATAAWAAGCVALFPLALSLTLGRSDYRGPADAIVVFGARAYADGSLSHALEDRVNTAAELYRAGLAPTVWMSGGPGDGDVHEVDAMRTAAIELGVAAEDVALDYEGWSTARTAHNLKPRLPAGGRVIAVSHGFHLTRVRLAFAREGLQVVTVPADSPERPLGARTRLHLRDALGFWAYWIGYGAA
ncbi:MAG: YdcF family protein [Planctomycetes bacterium]|nr:YdcF family protein [Planctomycetota bacterium]